jgi:nuclear pore complex protein Nup155
VVQTNVINSIVKLLGVFLEQINYLLVVATPVEIMLVAVAYSKENGVQSLNLYRTDIIISSDNVSMTSIVGTENGRIFMCGNNGKLYELQYQVKRSLRTFLDANQAN